MTHVWGRDYTYFKVTTMGKETIVLAKTGQEAVVKFFKGIPDLRRWIEERKLGGALVVEFVRDGKEMKRTVPCLPLLINLGAVSMEEGIQYLLRYNKMPRQMCIVYLEREVQRTQWVKDWR